MATKGFDRKKYLKPEAILLLERIFLKARSSGYQIFLISPGNYSKGDYEDIAREINARVVASRSALSGIFKLISAIIPASAVGALLLDGKAGESKTIVDLADHGYILLFLSKRTDAESMVKNAVDKYSARNFVADWLEHLSGAKKIILNGEESESVEVETDFSTDSL